MKFGKLRSKVATGDAIVIHVKKKEEETSHSFANIDKVPDNYDKMTVISFGKADEIKITVKDKEETRNGIEFYLEGKKSKDKKEKKHKDGDDFFEKIQEMEDKRKEE